MVKHTENAVQRHLLHWIKTAYPSAMVIAIRNEDMRNRSDELVIGHPDLHIEIKAGGLIHILKLELKSTTGKLSPGQKKWNAWFDDNHKADNCQRDVAYGFNEAKRIVTAWIERHLA